MPRSEAAEYISTTEAAVLEDCAPRTMRWRAANKKTGHAVARGKNRGGKSGAVNLIPISELSVEARLRYQMAQEGVGADAEADLASYRERYGAEGLDALMQRLDAARELKLLRAEGRLDIVTRRREIAVELGVTVPRVYQMEHDYAAEGLPGLMERTMRADKGKSRSLCPLAQDRISYLYMGSEKMSQNRAHCELCELRDKIGCRICEECCHNPDSYNRELMREQGIDPGEECDRAGGGLIVAESRCAVNRYIQTLDRAVLTLGRFGGKAFDDRYMPKIRREKPTKVNETWFGDHHIFDLFVDIGDGKAARPWLTAWSDACSDAIVGWGISLNPNSQTIIESMAAAMQVTKGSPFSGMPHMVYIDNGKDYRSRRIEGDGESVYELDKINLDATGENALFKTLGIGVSHAKPYVARSKTIERHFRTLEAECVRGLPGYCGNGVEIKPERYMDDIRKMKLLTYEEFVALWVNVLLPKFNNFKAEGVELSPLERYQTAEKARDGVPDPRILAMAKDNQAERTVRTDGIYLNKRRYWDNALSGIIGEKVRVLYSANAATLSVMHNGAYICEVTVAETFRLLGEEREKLEKHLAMQARTRKNAIAALRLPADRVRFIDRLAVEIPDLAQPATITSFIHARAYEQREAARRKLDEKADTRKKVSGSIRARYEAAGAALLAQPDWDG